MDEIVKELAKPVWWISVVVAGIVINILSAYLKGTLDQSLFFVSKWWRNRSIKHQDQWQRRIEKISSSTEIKREEMHYEIRLRIQSASFLLKAILMLLFSIFASTIGLQMSFIWSVFIFGASAFSGFAAFIAYSEANSTREALQEAKKKS